MTRGWWIAVGIVAAANAAAVGGAAWNRQGEPEAVLELTERELELPPAAAENTALALRLRWTDPGNERLVPVEQPSPPVAAAPPPAGGASSPIPQAPPVPAVPAASWFDRAKLEEVGFDCSLPLDRANAARYRAMPPRRTYAVLEYEGEAWRSLERSRGSGGRQSDRASRLVVVDAGPDRKALRARWPDRRRAVVVPATAALVVEGGQDGRYVLHGRVIEIFPSQLNVPRPLNRVLAPLQRRTGDEGPARYRVRVIWGRRDPWIADVQP
ncbi:MAG TPA: DUF4824 family protein [Vicinamibacterales bacterium]|nr:DUF4824 family protein [Acidobacteriota bacterium]HOC16706.1 DUF4824 family protein [Vicinamibacterales bacterium]